MKIHGRGAATVAIVLAVTLAYGAYAAVVPHLFLAVAGTVHDLGKAEAGQLVTLHYRHSVQQTHVWEYLHVNKTRDGFVLTGTKYRSYGVGLPFLPGEGNYHSDGEYFYLENMQRLYPEVRLRVGLGTELTVATEQKKWELYRDYPPGTLVQLRVAPWWRHFLF